MSFQKLNISSLPRFQSKGVCDVCNKPVSPGEAYIVDNKTFYGSPEYRDHLRNTPSAAMIGAENLNDAYFDGLLAKDTSPGSAVCPDCIHMFAESDDAPETGAAAAVAAAAAAASVPAAAEETPAAGKKRFRKLDINTLERYAGSGVCDVCGKPVSADNSYVIDNYTFYHSPQYRLRCMRLNIGAARYMNGRYFEDLYKNDRSAGSAVCADCVKMFASDRASKKKNKDGKKKTRLGIIIPAAAVLLALLIAGTGILFFGGNSEDSSGGGKEADRISSYSRLDNSSGKYNEKWFADAKEMYREGDLISAYLLYKLLGDYENSASQAEYIFRQKLSIPEKLSVAEAGDELYLYKDDAYEYDADEHVPSYFEMHMYLPYRVIAKEGDKLLLAEDDHSNHHFWITTKDEYRDYYYVIKSSDNSDFYPELRPFISSPRRFIPDIDTYNKYIKDNQELEFYDDYGWLVFNGDPDDYEYDERVDGKLFSYAGCDNVINGRLETDEIIVRRFLWLDLSEGNDS